MHGVCLTLMYAGESWNSSASIVATYSTSDSQTEKIWLAEVQSLT